MIEIDGSQGEGGGQVLRSALTLSALTGRAFRLIQIRANRPRPGLAAQHLACVRACAAICDGVFTGGSLGSSTLTFEPKTIQPGNYDFRIGTAGATSLVLQTVALPLALRTGSQSTVVVSGGTHVPHSPCYEFLEQTWLGYLGRCGVSMNLECRRRGFYPRGGGEVALTIEPTSGVRPINLTSVQTLESVSGIAAVADLSKSIQKTLQRRMSVRMKAAKLEPDIEAENWENGPAAVAILNFRDAGVPTVFSAIGERGKPADAVANAVCDEAIQYAQSGSQVDEHSADQLVLPLVFAPGPSEFRTAKISRHLLTNIDTIRHFVDRNILCEGNLGKPGLIRVE